MIAAAVNARGDVAGSFYAADGYMHAYRWTEAGGLEDLGTNGGYASLAFNMNDNGDVVGTYWDRSWGYHPFIARPGRAITDLSVRYPQIEQINSISNDGRLTRLDGQYRTSVRCRAPKLGESATPTR